MKAAIYNPYIDTLGGGERYTLAFASVLVKNGYQVDLEWKDPSIKESLEKRFGIDLKKINIISDTKKGDGYDLCFWVSDGSVPLMHARHNILHFQVPFHGVNGSSLINKMKFFRINNIVCNSNFTKKVIDKEFGVKSIVIYPPVDTTEIKPMHKENIILYVGRFSQILQNKGQETLVEVFKDMDIQEWKLVLAGGIEVGATNFVNELRAKSQGLNIEIIESPDFKTLKTLYGRAKIFWSAAGFGQNEDLTPEKMEHFGITIVEAMVGGAVPVVYNGGGYKEIITNSINGYLWNTKDELIAKTKEAIDNRNKLIGEIEKTSKLYSYDEFRKNIEKIL